MKRRLNGDEIVNLRRNNEKMRPLQWLIVKLYVPRIRFWVLKHVAIAVIWLDMTSKMMYISKLH